MSTTELSTLSFTMEEEMSPEVLALLFGGPVGESPPAPTYSVIFDQVREVSGEPPRPARQCGFVAWLTRANARASRQWVKDRQAWVDAGSPPIRQPLRTHVPHARLEATE